MLIVNNCQLKQFYQECQKDKYIALDTEFYWADTYKPIPCIIQIANSNRSILIDLISYKLELKYIEELLVNKNIKKIFHSARQDLEILFNLFGKLPINIFDTQIASLVIGFSDSPSLECLCKELLNANLLKENQRMDWRVRPLTSGQIKYAINDVKYLIPLYKIISFSIKKLNRNNWCDEHYLKLKNIKNYTQKEKIAWKKIKFKPKFINEVLIMKKIAEIRERIAKRMNVPPKHLMNDSKLIKICKINEEVDLLKIFNKESRKNKFEEFKNKELRKELVPVQGLTETQKDKLKIAKKLLKKKSFILNIHPSIIANKHELEDMVLKKKSFLLKGWRYEVFGKDYIKLIS